MNHLTKVLLCCLIALWLSPFTALAQSVLYVDASAGGSDDGTSWANAYTDLQNAITASTSGDEIWVAAGTYYPDEGVGFTNDNRDATFQLKNGVALYGGLIGTETQLSERDWENNPTILSGDINQNGDWAGNSYTVVTGSNTDNTAVLDGFIITKGIANGNPTTSSTGSSGRGGGMYNEAGSPRVANCVFSGNYAFWGGGMYNVNNSSPSMINIVFLSNLSIYGGGMYNNYYSSPIVTNSSFIENNGGSAGGGAYNNNYSSPVIKNSAFSGNTSFDGGGMYNNNHSSPSITNSSFIGNYFEDPESTGGGMCNINSSNPNITNSLFSGNSTGYFGGGLFNSNSNPILTNTIIWNNTVNGSTNSTSESIYNSNNSSSTISYSLIANSGGSGSWDSNIGTDSGNNIDANPQFADAANGDYSLLLTSPAVNTGDPNTDLNLFLGGASAALDLADNPRLVSGIIDMGAFENQTPCPTGGIVFVNTNATGDNNGTSWTDAYTNLQDALNSSCPNVAEIWVAQGTYYPDEGVGITDNDRNATFQLKNGVAIYGGFAGTESTVVERDWFNNVNILSGDINQNGSLTGNAYSVVTGSGTDNTAVIDGFTITAGNANRPAIFYDPTPSGGGMFNNNGSPTVTNCTFSGNSAVSNGGGIFNFSSSPKLINCTFLGNSAPEGGGMANRDSSSPTVTNSTFSGNSANFGGGMLNEINSSPMVTNCIFSGNSANFGGGMLNENNSSPTVTNSTFSGNSASSQGGGIYNFSSSPTVTNCTFSGNTASSRGGGMYNVLNSSPTATNCIIWNNTASGSTTSASASVFNDTSAPVFSFSLIANSGGIGSWAAAIGTDGGNNIDADPLFVTPSTPGLNTGGDYRLQACSPAINAGSNAAVPSGVTTDLDGNPRFFNNGTVDMGAYESQAEDNENPVAICPTTAPTVVLDGSGNGTLPANALAGGNSTDNCAAAVTETSPMTSFSCADAPTATVVLTATDAAGNMHTANCAVNIVDNENPVAICPNTAPTVMLDGSGNGTLPANALAGGNSTDNCNATESSPMTSFTCADAPTATVVLTATDAAGNMHTANCTVNIVDSEKPTASCENITVQLDANRTASITAADIDGGSTDNCGSVTLSISGATAFDCDDVGIPQVATLTVTDANNNSSECDAMVTVEDNIAPTALCSLAGEVVADQSQPINIGAGASNIDNHAQSFTAGISGLLSRIDLKLIVVTEGNVIVSIRQSLDGPILAQETVNLTFGDNELYTIVFQTPTTVTAGQQYFFRIDDAGGDFAPRLGIGCFGLCDAYPAGSGWRRGPTFNGGDWEPLQFADFLFTTFVNTPPIIVQLDAGGNGSITPEDIDNGSSDNCGIANLSVNPTSFDCTNFGENMVTLAVTDVNGNMSTCTSTVTVEDNEAPTAICPTTPPTVVLDGNGNGTLAENALAGGNSTDNCSATESSPITSFTCADAPTTTVVLTATDAAGNMNTVSCTVNIADNEAPVAICPTTAPTVVLDGSGNGTLPANALAGGNSTDNCNATESSPMTSFTCADAPTATVVLTATDAAGNMNMANCAVNITDNENPVAICPATAPTVVLDGSGNGTLPANALAGGNSTDNCNATETSPMTSFSCADAPTANVVLTATDAAGNMHTANCTVNIADNEKPTASCENITVQLDANRTASITAADIDGGSTDNCGSVTLSISGATTFDCDDVGIPQVATLTVTDVNNNSSECDATVTVADDDNPCTTIFGNIVWEHDLSTPVPDATVTLSGDDAGSENTDALGDYAIPTAGGNSLTLTPTKTTGDAYEGVDAADVTRIQQHVTFVDRFDDGYKAIAADVNQSNSVTGLDAAVLFHAINGNPNAKDIFEDPAWRFVDSTHTFVDENAPWGFPEDISLMNVMADVVNQSFVGVKMGDVNGTWATPVPLTGLPLSLMVQDVALKAGQTLRVPFRANGLLDVAAWQFALRFDTDYLRFERALPTAAFPLKDENFGAWQADRGELRSVFAVPQGLVLPKDEVIFELEFQVVYDGLQLSEVLSLDNGILDGRVYDTALNGGAVALSFEAVETRRIASLLPGEAALGFALEQNIPNPFSNETLVRFQLPEAGEAVFSVHDVQGRLLYEQRGFLDAGQHEVRLDAARLGATGVLSYTLRCGAHSATRRMVLVR